MFTSFLCFLVFQILIWSASLILHSIHFLTVSSCEYETSSICELIKIVIVRWNYEGLSHAFLRTFWVLEHQAWPGWQPGQRVGAESSVDCRVWFQNWVCMWWIHWRVRWWKSRWGPMGYKFPELPDVLKTMEERE